MLDEAIENEADEAIILELTEDRDREQAEADAASIKLSVSECTEKLITEYVIPKF